ncbi:AMP-binding protein [Candidatus Omnitrophota bacterium]
MTRNLCEAFTEGTSKYPRLTAIQWKSGNRWIKISYKELQGNVKMLSSALSRYYGVKKGDRVAILLGNRPEWPTVFFALISAGAIPVPVNQLAPSGEIEHILNDSGCKIAFTESGCPSIGIKTVWVDSDEFKRTLYLFPENAPGGMEAKRDDIACIMYTSGTTASPKGVMLSHGNLLSNTDSLYKLGLMKQGDGVVAVLPLYHTYALVVTTITPLLYGGRVVFPGSMRSKEVIASIKEARGAIFVGVPLVFNAFHKTITDSIKKMPAPVSLLIERVADFLYIMRKKTGINLARYFFYSIHGRFGRSMYVSLSGGSKLKENIEIGLSKFGFTILSGYGLTETSPVLTMTPYKKPKVGSVGLPIADVELKIRQKDKKDTGEILVRGPNVMKGYYKKEDLTREVMEDGWLKTGDIGYMDEDGYLFLTGRIGDIITLELGLNIYPDEIEEAYSSGTPVKEICIFDVPSQKGIKETSVLWAVAVPDMEFFRKKGIMNPYSAVKTAFESVSRQLSIPERLMGISLTLDVLPRTLLGKVKRRKVKELYLSGEIKEAFHPPKKQLTQEELAAMRKPEAVKVVNCLRRQTKIAEITPADSFELDLGIDLIGREEIASELEKELGLSIKEGEINALFTVGELMVHAEKTKNSARQS